MEPILPNLMWLIKTGKDFKAVLKNQWQPSLTTNITKTDTSITYVTSAGKKKAETFFFYFSETKSTTFKLLKKYTVFIHNQNFSNKFIETTLVKQPFDELCTLSVPLCCTFARCQFSGSQMLNDDLPLSSSVWMESVSEKRQSSCTKGIRKHE